MNPELRKEASYEVEYLQEDRSAVLEEEYRFRFRLKDTLTGWPVKGLRTRPCSTTSLRGGTGPRSPPGRSEEGVYEAVLRFRESGAYNVYVGVPSRKIGYRSFVHRSLVVRKQGAPDGGTGSEGKSGGGERTEVTAFRFRPHFRKPFICPDATRRFRNNP